MKKLLFALSFLVALCIAAGIIVWGFKTQIVAHFLGKQFHVSASVGTFDLTKTRATLDQIWIGTPRGSRTNTSFAAQNLTIDSSWDQMVADPLVIDQIELNSIFVGIEFYNRDGKDNNWSRMMATPHKEKKKQRGYLIRTLVLNNLTVQVTKADGSTKQYPTISRMEFHNISDETGLPLDQIEKAIFQLVLKELFQKLDLNQIIDTINAIKGGAPVRIPKLF